MKKLKFSLAAAMLLSSSALAFAANPPAKAVSTAPVNTTTTPTTLAQKAMPQVVPVQQDQKSLKKNPKVSQDDSDAMAVNLYATPDKSANIIGKVDTTQDMVPFFRKNGWIKVGNPEDGQVGWINKAEYHKAVIASFHRNVQTMFIEVDQTKNNPVITAYKNGKKLTSEEAQALYKKIQKRQARMNRKLRHFKKRMRSWYRREMNNVQSVFMPLPSSQIMQPVVILERDPMMQKGNTKVKVKPTEKK